MIHFSSQQQRNEAQVSTRMRLGVISALALCTAALAPAPATLAMVMETPTAPDDVSAQELAVAREIVEAAGSQDVMQQALDSMIPMMSMTFLGALSASEKGRSLLAQIDAHYPAGRDGFGQELVARFAERFKARFDEIAQESARQYALRIPLADLIAIRDFMKSSAGKKLSRAQVEIIPLMARKGETVGAEVGEAAGLELVTEFLDGLRKDAPST